MPELETNKAPLKDHPILNNLDWADRLDKNKLLDQLSKHAYRVTNHDVVGKNYTNFSSKVEEASEKIDSTSNTHFAVKAHADPLILEKLIKQGASFEIATYSELKLLLENGLTEDQVGARVSFGQTQKEPKDIALALKKGLRTFAPNFQMKWNR